VRANGPGPTRVRTRPRPSRRIFIAGSGSLESPYFNSVLQQMSADPRYNRELTAAKEEFQAFAGPIFESDRNFDARINAFHNWYILDRPLKANGRTPIAYFLEFNANTLSEEQRARFEELVHHVHSLFELIKTGPKNTVLRDVLTGKKFVLDGVQQTQHLDKGALFNTRLFRHQEQWYFSNYVILHPGSVARDIKQAAKRNKKAKTEAKPFLYQLMLFQGRWEQYKQMDLHAIYRFGA
jgi:hypothetical protein